MKGKLAILENNEQNVLLVNTIPEDCYACIAGRS
jgi:hypothetical protein